MKVEQAQQIRACAELSVGDEIEAWHNGKLFHRGRVSQTVASMDLFWIVEAGTGARRLIDVDALVILKVRAADSPGPDPAVSAAPAASAPGPAPAPGAGSAPADPAAKPAKVRPRELVPTDPRGVLFQAPDLRDAGLTGAGW